DERFIYNTEEQARADSSRRRFSRDKTGSDSRPQSPVARRPRDDRPRPAAGAEAARSLGAARRFSSKPRRRVAPAATPAARRGSWLLQATEFGRARQPTVQAGHDGGPAIAQPTNGHGLPRRSRLRAARVPLALLRQARREAWSPRAPKRESHTRGHPSLLSGALVPLETSSPQTRILLRRHM